MSFLENPCRRGYEAAGMSLREGDPLPDAKEVRVLLPASEVQFLGFVLPQLHAWTANMRGKSASTWRGRIR